MRVPGGTDLQEGARANLNVLIWLPIVETPHRSSPDTRIHSGEA